MRVVFGRIVYTRGMTVHVMPEPVADPSKNHVLRLFAGGTGTGVNGFLASVFSDPASKGRLDGPLITTSLPESQMHVAPRNTHIFAVV